MSSVDSEVFLDSRAVRRRYGGRSDMALWRWLRDPPVGIPSADLHPTIQILAPFRLDRMGAHAAHK